MINTTKLKFSVGLYSLNHNFNRKKNIIIHHGLMGSSKNFKGISKTPAFSNHCNVYLLDARNHGIDELMKEIVRIRRRIDCHNWLMMSMNLSLRIS